jgi:hypothetical protein
LDELVQFGPVWRFDALKAGWPVFAIYIDTIQEQDVKVDI